VAQSCSTIQFADDINLYAVGRNIAEITSILQRNVLSLVEYFGKRGLKVNPAKTTFMVIRKKSVALPPNTMLLLNGTAIAPAIIMRYLGLTIDEHLTFSPQIDNLTSQVGRKLRAFRHCRSQLDLPAKKLYYTSIIQSSLEYASNAYVHCLSTTQYDRLTALARRAIRTISGIPPRADVAPVLLRWSLCPLPIRINAKLYQFLYRCTHDLTGHLCKTLFNKRCDANHTHAETRGQVSASLALPQCFSRPSYYAISYLGADRWNSLPSALRTASSYNEFTNAIHQYLGYPVKRPRACGDCPV